MSKPILLIVSIACSVWAARERIRANQKRNTIYNVPYQDSDCRLEKHIQIDHIREDIPGSHLKQVWMSNSTSIILILVLVASYIYKMNQNLFSGNIDWGYLVIAGLVGSLFGHMGACYSQMLALSSPSQPPVMIPPTTDMMNARTPSLNLSGVWIKDKQRSDSMDAACDAMKLNMIMRKAIHLIQGVEISIDNRQFLFTVLSGIMWFKVREKYSLDGSPSRHKRRDLRRGGAQGTASIDEDGFIHLHSEFGNPLAGNLREIFYLFSQDELHIAAVLSVPPEADVVYTQVYRRKR